MASPLPTTLVRSNDGFLSAPEQRLLQWLAPRLPGWITPNLLTAFGFAGSVIALASYTIVERHPSALWLVNVGLIVNWSGDSLDRKIARLRGIERPRYGLFLDHSIDVLSQLLFVAGLAVSGYVRVEIVATGFTTFLMMNVQGLPRAEIRRVFPPATGCGSPFRSVSLPRSGSAICWPRDRVNPSSACVRRAQAPAARTLR